MILKICNFEKGIGIKSEKVSKQVRDRIVCIFLVSSAPLLLQLFDVENILGFYTFSFPPFQVFPYFF